MLDQDDRRDATESATSIYAPSTQGFESLLRISRSSVAYPPWFAPPVDAAEDESSITVVFHAPERSHGRVRVQASDQSVTVWGRSQEVRVCALPCSIVAHGIETSRSGDLVRVRVPKKRSATDSTESSASTSP